MNIEGQIKKLKFDMEKEEKNAIRRKEKEIELAELEYAKEQILLKNKIAEEQARKEKKDTVERQLEFFEETRTAKKLKREEEDKRTKENLYDHLGEKKLREQLPLSNLSTTRDAGTFRPGVYSEKGTEPSMWPGSSVQT